jgi:hypothetical protein
MGVLSKARAVIHHYRNFDPERAYLEKSTSLIDLERRQREIDNGRFRRSRTWPY